MIANFTILVIGFSVLSSVVLLFAYSFFLKDMRKTATAVASCAALLGCVSALQLEHLRYLQSGADLLGSRPYVLLLLASPPAFYFFSREVLLPDAKKSIWQAGHLIPLLLGGLIPLDIAAPVAFAIGTGYGFWFARIVYGLKEHSSRFKFEMFFFTLFAVLALLVLVLGLSVPYLDHRVFYMGYANAIGIAFLLIVSALIVFPELLSDISEAATLAYASSTLGNVDVEAVCHRLQVVMDEDKLFQNENLNLSLLASELDVSSHQLSELINTRFGVGFSRYVRERRVAEAKRLLTEDPQSSVLAIGLMTGFKSQSNFYAAFRDITGEAPGSYRRRLHNG